MIIRNYLPGDCSELADLFYNTVHTINAKDYTKEQLDAWASGQVDLSEWNISFMEHYTLVAIENGMIVGFGDITPTGYLDHLFVHKNYQGKGVGSAICSRLEQTAFDKVFTQSSVTAKGFFAKRGYVVVKEQQVERQGVWLTNFVMEKELL